MCGVTNFFRANSLNQPVRKFDQIWKKPETGCVKINIDVSLHAETLAGACSASARDDRGYFIAAATWPLVHVPTVVSSDI